MKIMVRADDLGYSRGVNYGIYDTVKKGVIKNIGFMVNMPDSVDGYELVKDLDICLGQHTNVCIGTPISDPKLIPSLVDENGQFKSSRTYRQSKEDFVVLEEAIIEIEAQYERFKEMVENAHDDGCDLLVCHPGYLDAQILRTSSLTLDRTKEAEMLCSKELKDYLKEHDIHLYTYDEIGH